MTALLRIFRFMLAAEGRSLGYGAALSFVVLAMGAALLGLSGWFITASSAAGLAGIGIAFDTFRPSAGVRFLALGRTVARYGERLVSHDATLRTLTALRVRLLTRLAALPHDAMGALRGATATNRLIGDIDALDGIPLRLILPIAAGAVTQITAFFLLWGLVDLSVAAPVLLIYMGSTTLIFGLTLAASTRPSTEAETGAQAFRAGLIDLIRARTDLMVHGQIGREAARLAGIEAARRGQTARLNRIGRHASAALMLTVTGAAAVALAQGLSLAAAEVITPARAALGVLAALALGESIAPTERAATEIGRMRLAAARVAPVLDRSDSPAPATAARPRDPAAPVIALDSVSFTRPRAPSPVIDGLSLSVAPGEIVALTGPSGVGKSTVLALAAGLIAPSTGEVRLHGAPLSRWPEPDLRKALTLVPQRSALISGTIRENLALASPEAEDGALAAALEVVQLAPVLAGRGGLDARLGPHGAGLSGGETRRLALARALLRRPHALVLDEPTEGLDRATAERLLTALRAALPEAAILLASHRRAETDWADRRIHL